MSYRMIEPESLFGLIKNNRGFRRFLLEKAAMDQKREIAAQG